MTKEEQQQEIANLKGYLFNYITQQDYYKPNKKGFFQCQDPNHIDNNPSMMYNKKNNTCHCFACGATHDIFWFIQRDFNLNSFPEALSKARELFDGSVSNLNSAYIKDTAKKSYTDYYKTLENSYPTEYMTKRGFNDFQLQAFGCYYDQNHQSIVIPTSNYSYTERFINVKKDDDSQTRYKHYGESQLYIPIRQDLIGFKDIPPTFIVEGEIDAMSILAGAKIGENYSLNDKIKSIDELKALAIGLGSANNIKALINHLNSLPEELIKKRKFVLALDNDKAGKQGTSQIAAELDKLNVNYIIINPYGKYKDANEALVLDKDKFQRNIDFISKNYDQLIKQEIQFEDAFINNSGFYKEITFPSEQLKDTFEEYIKKYNISNYTTNDDHIYIPSNLADISKAEMLNLYDNSIYPTLDEYASFNNMFLMDKKIEEPLEKLHSSPFEIKEPSNEEVENKLKFLISDIYKSYFSIDISEAYIQSDDIYYHIEKIKQLPLSKKCVDYNANFKNHLDIIDNLYSNFESSHTNYKKLTKDLLDQLKKDNIQIDINKEKYIELGILSNNNKILKYPEFYKKLNEDLKNPIKEDQPLEDKQQIKPTISNSKEYEKNTPYVLRNLPIFVCWKNIFDETTGEYKKIPINPKNGKPALINEEERCFPPIYDEKQNIVFEEYKDKAGRNHKKIKRDFNGKFDLRRLSDDSCSWTDFDTAAKAVEKWGCDGIGINAVKHLNLFVVNMNDIKTPEGELNETAKDFIASLSTYSEYSPSGNGIHMIGYADIDEKRIISNKNIQLYSAKHFITLTGNLVDGVPVKICNKKSATPIINGLIRKYIGSSEEEKRYFQSSNQSNLTQTSNSFGFDNETILKKCSAMYEVQKSNYNGLNIFDELYNNGNWEMFFKSQSDADLFLVGRLKFFSDSKSQIDELFRSSGLMRSKWDQSINGITYGLKTINYCFEKQKFSYSKNIVKE